MRKEFYLDQLDNFNFKCSFSQNERISIGDESISPVGFDEYGNYYMPEGGHVLHVSINKGILLDGIRGFIGHHNSFSEVVLYANFECTTFGDNHKFLIVREDDGSMSPYVDMEITDSEGLDVEMVRMNFAEYMPLHLIDFLTEYPN